MAAEHHAPIVSRRTFVQGAGVAGLGLLAGCGRLPWQVQSPAKAYAVGFLVPFPLPVSGTWEGTAFIQALREYGWIEGENIVIEYRSAQGRWDRLPDLAAELVGLPVDVLVAFGPAIRPAKNATSTTPIIMVNAANPVANGLVESLAHPGGNITGVTFGEGFELGAKRLSLLQEAIPSISRVLVIQERGNGAYVQDTRRAARTLDISLRWVTVSSPAQFKTAFDIAVSDHLDAIIPMDHALLNNNNIYMVALERQYQLPAMHPARGSVTFGGLMGYGINRPEQGRRAAYYVDRILTGTKPPDLPIEQPRTFDFAINLKTAQALGLTIPQHVLLQATEILQ
ncbi:MAG TPA: ABC transporter substrate-binding protein [Chloroflexota bacterium]|jgi:putative ABC transport system substrate-binding protein